jgi:hypothetical protein
LQKGGKPAPSLLKKKASAAVAQEEQRAVVELADEEPTPMATPGAKKRGTLVLLDSDEEDGGRAGSDEEALAPEPEARAEEEQDETPVPDAKERKRAKREKREMARTNQQLMIQSALLGANSEIPKKVPKKMDEFAFAQRLKGRLQNVVGRFAPESVSTMETGGGGKAARRVFLTADLEVDADAERVRLEEDELLVVADEPAMVLEPPKPKPVFRNTLDAIFGGQNEAVGAIDFDSTRVWVSQLPAFRGIDLWNPRVTLVPRTEAAKEESSSDGDYQDDELEDVDIEDEDDGDLPEGSAANSSQKAAEEEDQKDGEEEEEEEEKALVNPFDEDGDRDDDDYEDAELKFSDEEPRDPRHRFPGLSLETGESLEASFPTSSSAPMGSLAEEQAIGLVLNKALQSQSSQYKSQSSQLKSQQQHVVDILSTPKKAFAPPTPKKQVTVAEDVDEDADLFDKESDEAAPEPVAPKASVRKNLSLSLGMDSPPSSPQRDAIALESGEPATLPLYDDDEEEGDEIVAPVSPAKKAAAAEEPKVSIVVAAAAAPPPVVSAPTSGLIVDPVERAKKLATAKVGLDRFIVRGEAAKKMIQAATASKAAVQKKVEKEEEEIQDSDNEKKRDHSDVFDDEEEDEASNSSPKKAKSVSFLESEAAESDGLDDENANFPLDEKEREAEANGEDLEKGSDEDVFSAEGAEGDEEGEDGDGNEDDEGDAKPARTAEEEQEAEDMEAINKLRMEKDLAELNRIKDLYVLGHWKTEKLQNRQQMGMEDYVDDEFQPAWNSIYNRDAVRARLNRNKEGDAKDPAAADGAEGEQPLDEEELQKRAGAEAVGSSDDEEEYERRREKLKQSMQLAKINAIFGGSGGGGGGASMGPTELSRGESSMAGGGLMFNSSNSVMLDAPPSAASLDVAGLGENSRVSRLIENRRETSNAAMGMFGGLMRDKTAEIDPMQRFAMRRSTSKLMQHAQQDTSLKRQRSTTGNVINVTGRQFFEAGDASNSNAGSGSNKQKSPKKPRTPKKATPQKPSVLQRPKKK